MQGQEKKLRLHLNRYFVHTRNSHGFYVSSLPTTAMLQLSRTKTLFSVEYGNNETSLAPYLSVCGLPKVLESIICTYHVGVLRLSYRRSASKRYVETSVQLLLDLLSSASSSLLSRSVICTHAELQSVVERLCGSLSICPASVEWYNRKRVANAKEAMENKKKMEKEENEKKNKKEKPKRALSSLLSRLFKKTTTTTAPTTTTTTTPTTSVTTPTTQTTFAMATAGRNDGDSDNNKRKEEGEWTLPSELVDAWYIDVANVRDIMDTFLPRPDVCLLKSALLSTSGYSSSHEFSWATLTCVMPKIAMLFLRDLFEEAGIATYAHKRPLGEASTRSRPTSPCSPCSPLTRHYEADDGNEIWGYEDYNASHPLLQLAHTLYATFPTHPPHSSDSPDFSSSSSSSYCEKSAALDLAASATINTSQDNRQSEKELNCGNKKQCTLYEIVANFVKDSSGERPFEINHARELAWESDNDSLFRGWAMYNRHSLHGGLGSACAAEGGFAMPFCTSTYLKFCIYPLMDDRGDCRGLDAYRGRPCVPLWAMVALRESLHACGVPTSVLDLGYGSHIDLTIWPETTSPELFAWKRYRCVCKHNKQQQQITTQHICPERYLMAMFAPADTTFFRYFYNELHLAQFEKYLRKKYDTVVIAQE